MNWRKTVVLLAFLAFAFGAKASESITDPINPPRPKVGIVLGGGGAKGAAHIGVLKYIEEIGLPVDYVVGTSMGSIIGGLYALGYSPYEIENLISQLDWSQYMSNNVERMDISSADKLRRSTYLINISFNHGELKDRLKKMKDDEQSSTSVSLISSLPDAFIGGTDLLNLFNSLCIGYQDSTDFNELPIPFACVATNLTTGEAVVLRSGKFPEAIRASMAIPGVFSPMTIDGQLLVDGGLVNNFPTDVCREMGADIIIGVEVAQGLIIDPEKLKSLPQLISQLKNIVIKGHNEENRQLCDLYLHPQVNDYNMLSFSTEAIDTIVRRGYEFAMKYHDELSTIKSYIDSYEPATKILQAPKAQYVMHDTIRLRNISMHNVKYKEFRWLLRKSKLQLGTYISSDDIHRAINIFKGTGSFDKIEYLLKPSTNPMGPSVPNDFDLHLFFHFAEPHNLSLGFNYDSEESVGLILNLGLGQNKFSGLKFNFTGRLGFNTKINGTLTWAGISLANFNLSYEFNRSKYNSYLSDQSTALLYNQSRLRFYISEFHLRNIQTSVGFETENTYYPYYSIATGAVYGPYAKFSFDNMDNAYFATQGFKTNVEIHGRFCKDQSPAMADLSFNILDHYSFDRLTLIPHFYSRAIIGDNVLYPYYNIIGGEVSGRYYDYQIPFVGINHTTLMNPYTAVARLDVRYRFYQNHYLTATANAVRSINSLSTAFDFTKGINRWGCALKYSYDSPIGPISFDLHYSDITKTWGSYFSLGYIF